MTPRFCTLWSFKMALWHSADLIHIGSSIRVAGFAVPEAGAGKIANIVTDSGECTGKGKIVHGLLVGSPNDRRALQC